MNRMDPLVDEQLSDPHDLCGHYDENEHHKGYKKNGPDLPGYIFKKSDSQCSFLYKPESGVFPVFIQFVVDTPLEY